MRTVPRTGLQGGKGGEAVKRYGDIFGISGHTTQGGERIDIRPGKD